ncbi:MAG: hypothetical protein ACWGMZ_00620, partial [Thermoguttaceae bacterium]
MRCPTASHFFGLLSVFAATLTLSINAWAQTNNNSSDNNSSNSSNNITQSGVVVDAQGVLRTQTFTDQGGLLTQQRILAAKSTLDANVIAYSKLRKVSLNRLEQVILRNQGV